MGATAQSRSPEGQSRRRSVRADREAVTPVIGAMLMIAIVFILALSFWWAVQHLRAHSTPEVQSGAKAYFGAEGYWIVPTGPDAIPMPGTRLFITIDGVERIVPLANLTALIGSTTQWDVGTRMCIVGPAADCYRHSGQKVKVAIFSQNNFIFDEPALLDTGPGFIIGGGGGITTVGNRTVVTGALGSQITCGAGGPVIPVTARLSIDGGATYSSLFGGQPVSPSGSGQTFNAGVVPAGSVVVAEGTAASAGCGNYSRTVNSVANPTFALILKAGDPAPSYAPFSGQAPLATFLVPYVNTQTQSMVLAPNQVIIFFELGTTDLQSGAADFQDLVILLTFQ